MISGLNTSGIEAAIRNIRTNTLGFKGAFTGFNQNWVDRVEQYTERNTNRLDTAIGALTDADLGKTSAARATAETRQRLALQTVRQAISAYGSFAGGLLGNVQRIQRGILA